MQAILIIAHTNAAQVYALTNKLIERFNVYIHFDRKYKMSEEYVEKFSAIPQVHVYSKYYVHWGAFSIVEVTLLLLKKAMENGENTYFHIISGMDWPVRDVNYIYHFYEKTDKIYLNFTRAEKIIKSGEPTIWWQKYYFDYDKINRKSLYGKIYHRLSIAFQTLRRVNKFHKLDIQGDIYEGSEWCDLPRYAVEYCLKQMEQNQPYYRMLKTGFCSDEFVFQTILCNSLFKSKLVNDNHRYIKWIHQCHDYQRFPAILTEEDFDVIHQKEYHFARKFDLNKSGRLIRMLDR